MLLVILPRQPERVLPLLLLHLLPLPCLQHLLVWQELHGIDIYKAKVLASLFVGAMIPFIFSSLAITRSW